MSARRTVFLLAATLLLPSCESGGHFSLLGYTTRPNYDCSIRTVRVPLFKNNTFRRGVEFDLTRAVIREIEAKTPFKVVGQDCAADTELTGTIVALNKNIIGRNQLNEVREAETVLAVEVIWKDLRSGECLSGPRPAPGTPPPLPGTPPVPARPVIVQSVGGFIPELGESLATAEQKNVNRLATQIVSMMETPW